MTGPASGVKGIIRERMQPLRDDAYRTFMTGLLPTMDPARILGVRTPALRRLAAEMNKEGLAGAFLDALPHALYEENNLHAYLVNSVTNKASALRLLKAFLPHVDNWATCDALNPKAFRGDPAPLLACVPEWLAAKHPYTQRYAIGVLLGHFLSDRFEERFLKLVGTHQSDEYYVNMMRAWYFSMALVRQWDAAVPWVAQRRLDPWTHTKTIRKAVESFQITPERKAYLKSLRQ